MSKNELLNKVIEKIFNDLKGRYPTPKEFKELGTQEKIQAYKKAWYSVINTSELCFKALQAVKLIEEVEQ